ncbi:MAG TPA: hypothetical protein VFE82_09690 [Ramlibacter sp.]|uniref:hypothetical protein n=1 Tax=Ramlibacter sp. TaxID=1917967 RepID=UPI002D245D6F|nr:hypothetical protein [Ramlibacter sp.]HZY18744.1 hypothetical protein [Ramlibacter sp.]
MHARSLLLLLPFAAGPCAAFTAGELLPSSSPPPHVPNGTVVATPGLQVQYEPADATQAGPGRLEGVAAVPAGELRSSVRIDPNGERTLTRLETRWQLQAPGPLRTVVLGDTVASGGGWSRPVRLGGLRFGRPLSLRTDPTAPIDAARKPVAATQLAPGASDYEVEMGRVRSGWNAAEGEYGENYAAAAYRAGVTAGLTAEVRTEWTDTRQAQGLELSSGLGPGGSLQAVVAQSNTADESGLRWGMGVVRSTSGATWTLTWDAYERGFTPMAAAGGELHPRSQVRAGASVPLAGRVTADLSYAQQTTWDTTTPAAVMGLAAKMPVLRKSTLSLDYSWREGPQPLRRAAVVFAVPLDDGQR